MAECNDRKGIKMAFIKEILIFCFCPLLYKGCNSGQLCTSKEAAVMSFSAVNVTAKPTKGIVSCHTAKGLKAVNYGPE